MLEAHGIHPIVDCTAMCVGGCKPTYATQDTPLLETAIVKWLLQCTSSQFKQCCTIVKHQIKNVSACMYAEMKLDSEALRTSLTNVLKLLFSWFTSGESRDEASPSLEWLSFQDGEYYPQ